MAEQLMVKDLLAYHIREEQKKLKEHQDRLEKFFEAYLTDTPCAIDLTTVELPFDDQPINTSSDKGLFLQGKLIAGNNFAAYDIRRLWGLKILSIRPLSYPCEKTHMSFAGIWIVEFEGNIRVNFHGHFSTTMDLLKVKTRLGSPDEINENTIHSGGEMFNINSEERELTTFQHIDVLQYIATRSTIRNEALTDVIPMSPDIEHVRNGKLNPVTAYVDRDHAAKPNTLHLRKSIEGKDALVINISRVFNSYTYGRVDESIERATSTLSYWRHT